MATVPVKGLFESKLGVTFDSKETVLELNGCTIKAYPSNHIDNFDELLVCSDFDGLQMIYNNFFDSYKRVLDKYKRGEHTGIRWIGTLDKKEDRSNLIQIFLDLGVQIRHVKNIL